MNRLQANDRAPEFVARDFLGAPVDLQSLRGHKVMLSFYRYACKRSIDHALALGCPLRQ